jgi:hypothetical protein
MLRTFACVGVGLLLLAGGATAQNKTTAVQTKEMHGKIVKVDPLKNVIVIKTGDGTKAKEHEFKVMKTTKIFGTDRKEMVEGLRSKDFRPGADVWYREGGTATTPDGTVTELRLAPALNPGGKGQ